MMIRARLGISLSIAKREIWQTDTYFNPTDERTIIDKNIKGWYRAIRALEYWTKDEL